MPEEASPSAAVCVEHMEDAETEAAEETTGVSKEVWREEESAVVTTAIAST